MHSSLSSSERDDDVAFAKDQRCDSASVSHSSDGSQKQIVMTYPFSTSAPDITGFDHQLQLYDSILSSDLWNVEDC
jgi:hypothetical protein